MKDQILKLAGVKSEAAFYKKFPSEAAFMKVHGKALKKAAMGASMVKDQLQQLTDFGNPPIAQNGAPIAFGDLTANVNAQNAGMSRSQYDQAEQQKLAAQKTAPGAAPAPKAGGLLGQIGGALKQVANTTKLPAAAPLAEYGFEIPEAQLGGLFGKLQAGATKLSGQADTLMGKANAATKDFGGVAGIASTAGDILGGAQAMKEQKNQINTANQSSQVSGLALTASQTRPEEIKRQYARPEDALVQPGQISSPYGAGTNILGRDGLVLQDGGPVGGNPTELQNTYAPLDLYDDLGYEPLSDSDQVKQYAYGGDIPMAKFGDYFADSGQAQIGSAVGKSIGNKILPGVGGVVGGFLGKVGGNLLGGAKDAQELRGFQEDDASNIEHMALQQGAQQVQARNSNVMEDGGWVSNDWTPQVITKFGDYDVKDLFQPPNDADMLRAGGHLRSYTPPSERAMQTYAMGGELQVHKGEAEQLSTNPYLPDGGETIMFRGPSHANGGMPISYGQSPVEVEGGEPAVKLQDGGTGEDNLVVFGNLQIPNEYLSEIGDPKAKGKKFKNYVNDLSKIEARQNKIVDKSTNSLLDLDPRNSFDKMKFDSLHANIMGANMKLKDIAGKKQSAAAVQAAINDTAAEHGLVADDLAKGKFVKDNSKEGKARYGAAIEKAQTGKFVPFKQIDRNDYGTNYNPYRATDYEEAPAPYTPGFHPAPSTGGGVTPTQQALPFSQARGDFFSNRTNDNAPAAGSPQGGGETRPATRTTGGGGASGSKSQTREKLTPIDTKRFEKFVEGRNIETLKNLRFTSPEQKIDMKRAEIPVPTGEVKTPYDWEDTLSSIYNEALPYMRKSDQGPLDTNQLLGEMYALGNNQLEGVQAQSYQPQLQSVSDISYQDQLNANQADFNAIQRQTGYNPAALSALAAQKYAANSKVLGEQFRQNQGRQDQVRNQNIATLNEAQLRNLGTFDTQYQRQSQAKSNTKAATQSALNSISAKIAQNKLENRNIGINENMYNYRFDDQGRAINKNPLAKFNMSGKAGGKSGAVSGIPDDWMTLYDQSGTFQGTKKKPTKSRNGSIVKAIKNL